MKRYFPVSIQVEIYAGTMVKKIVEVYCTEIEVTSKTKIPVDLNPFYWVSDELLIVEY